MNIETADEIVHLFDGYPDGGQDVVKSTITLCCGKSSLDRTLKYGTVIRYREDRIVSLAMSHHGASIDWECPIDGCGEAIWGNMKGDA